MNPADHINLSSGGVDKTGVLSLVDSGGGPAAGNLTAPVAVNPNTSARAVEDNPLATPMPRAEIAKTSVNDQTNEWLNASMGVTAPKPQAATTVAQPPRPPAPPVALPEVAAPQPTTFQQPAPSQQFTLPTPPTPPAPPAPPAPPQQPPVNFNAGTAAVPQRTEADIFWDEIQAEIVKLQIATGQVVLDDPTKCDGANAVHVAIWNMRYNPNLIQMNANILCLYEAALSAQQAWVAGIENWWTSRYDFLGPELSKVLRQRRSKYSGPTEKAKEDAVCDSEPDVERLRREWVKAKAIATYLKGFGDRFAQLENGIKRAVNQAQEQERREGRGSRQTA